MLRLGRKEGSRPFLWTYSLSATRNSKKKGWKKMQTAVLKQKTGGRCVSVHKRVDGQRKNTTSYNYDICAHEGTKFALGFKGLRCMLR